MGFKPNKLFHMVVLWQVIEKLMLLGKRKINNK